MIFEKDLANRQLHVIREFKARIEKVWRAWTEAEQLDKWWGPKPWHVETKTMTFKPGGQWLYAMVGPAGEKHWSNASFTAVGANTFNYTCTFSDENGVTNLDFPAAYWHVAMKQDGAKTIVDVTVRFDDIAGLEKLIAMGFQTGFTMGLDQLEELLG
ncbi:MAG: SRPBCC family protein [Mucilaginibacter sp.]|uniref:SRPBCC family protein n=1 Tax=Mucilaginibacter sp. L3T2-6 TaxID=3062491 RepID=UPI0026755DAB|nr:SRPBCC domain-containing protein [Mucilaginibacter sp. L3T2-6]MDO3644916.1 SRPBCC domain-containing protein [Mucilaginibacter sp. L3T2-6]MDV6217367.1 SRPBCC domain-containing protein [Mucilaginibacter sp. L3T2-6]